MGNYLSKYILWVNSLLEINKDNSKYDSNSKVRFTSQLNAIIISDKETMIPVVIKRFNLDIYTSILLIIGVALETDNVLVAKLQTKNDISIIEFSHALELLNTCVDADHGLLGALCSDLHPIWYFFYNLLEGQFFIQKPFCMRKDILGWILDGCIVKNYLKIEDIENESYIDIQNDELRRIIFAAENVKSNKNVIAVLGNKQVGRKSLIKRVSGIKGKSLVTIDCDILFNTDDYFNTVGAAAACIVLNAYVCLINIRKQHAYMLKLFNMHMKIYGITIYAVAEEQSDISAIKNDIFDVIHVNDRLIKSDSISVWEKLFDHKVAEYMKIYNASIGEIIIIAKEIKGIIKRNKYSKINYKKAFNIYIRNQRLHSSYGTLIEPQADINEFVGNEEINKMIELIVFDAKNRNIIGNTYNSKVKRSLIILLHGTSGTGKTMLASVIASELEKLLLRADLSQVTDKYIGETEKHLDELFELTNKCNCVLFFDEADAVFSKRTQLSSSHDKYSNISVSYLLQKIDSFEGIIVMATNLINNFDEAFLRRINYIIKLPVPNSNSREKMWKKQVETLTSVDNVIISEINYKFLADNYKLSLARIKSVINTAYIIALKDNKGCLGMKQINEAVKIELIKEGRAVITDVFKEMEE